MRIEIIKANYNNPQHQSEIPLLLNEYANDPMGGGAPLSEHVQKNLVYALSQQPNALTFIAYANGTPAGLANCFQGFSTFQCQPLLNIHDMMVRSQFRGNGICTKLLKAIEKAAQESGCCKITLEVLSNNKTAQIAYKNFGFADYQLNPDAGNALFWQKTLNP